MKRLAATVAAIILGCSACNSGSAATSTTPLNKPYPSTTPALPATTALPTTTVALQTTTTPPPVTTTTPTIPATQPPTAVSLADDIISPEQQAIVDAATRTLPVIWNGVTNPDDPQLDANLQTVFVGKALETNRAYFENMRQKRLFVKPDPNQPYVLMPVPSTVQIDGDTASIRTCEVSAGLLYERNPDGSEQLIDPSAALFWRVLSMQLVDGIWRVSDWVDDHPGTPGNICRANP